MIQYEDQGNQHRAITATFCDTWIYKAVALMNLTKGSLPVDLHHFIS